LSRALAYVPLSAGRIENWRLEGHELDDLRASPYYTTSRNSPAFNKLFAALYDLMLGKLTNMGYLIPSPTRTLKEIFQEKIPGTDKFLVSAELIAYLKWLIYVAAFKDRSGLNHEEFYGKEVLFLNHPNNKQWRGHLFKALEAWYAEFKATKKRARRSTGKVADGFGIDEDRHFINVDNFDDPLADGAPAAGVALAAAAAAALAGGAAGH